MDTLQHPMPEFVFHTATKNNVYKKFMAWTAGQEQNRMLWLALALVGHGCVFTPITIFMITLSGNHGNVWPQLPPYGGVIDGTPPSGPVG